MHKNLSKKNNIDKVLLDYILKDTVFMKLSSKHISQGVLYSKNFLFLKKKINRKRIHSIDIFKNILNHFD